MSRNCTVVILASLLLAGFVWGQGQRYPYYQGKWQTAGKHYYHQYYYAKDKTPHYAKYYPKKYYPKYGGKKYVYHYNPAAQSKRYWGRYDTETGEYVLLNEDARKTDLDELQGAFDDQNKMKKFQRLEDVPIPGAMGLKMTPVPPLPD